MTILIFRHMDISMLLTMEMNYLTRERWCGGYFDPTRINFSAVGIFLGIITRQFTYLLLHSSSYLRCH